MDLDCDLTGVVDVPDGSEGYFSEDYFTCRERFRDAALSAGATLHCLELGMAGPQGESLSTDIAWFGAELPKSLLIHISGTHGVEGFAGSAIQLSLLEDVPADLPEGCACVFVHSMNPYGHAWLRRCNEANVDLNRNWVKERPLLSPLYHELQYFLNPSSPPSGLSWLNRLVYYLQGIFFILSYGYDVLKQAVAEGQYLYPRGLFFGGHTTQQGPEALMEFLEPRFSQLQCLFGIDVHTGLGPWAEYSLLSCHDSQTPAFTFLKSVLGDRVQAMVAGEGVAYDAHGELLPGIAARTHTEAQKFLVVQEFGVYDNLETLYALREENRFHYYGEYTSDSDYLQHPVKIKIKEVFCSMDPIWRSRVVAQGRSVFVQMMQALKA